MTWQKYSGAGKLKVRKAEGGFAKVNVPTPFPGLYIIQAMALDKRQIRRFRKTTFTISGYCNQSERAIDSSAVTGL